MPTYIFSRDAFIRFLEAHLDEDVVVVVSSDITDFKKERTDSMVGEKDYYFMEFAVAGDLFQVDEEGVDELMKYAIIFVEKELLSEVGKKAVR
ncbi:AF2331 family protein [Archaeoglobus neptunius]|uniref:AF2331 family protein n=1 Tax=Archaeoglobus neptunius TaxID=2798580 RepID=UPI001927B8BA|nr:AF2331 family protein [Archaeoglobus neptunius]